MTQPAKSQEPSMEEILASIRRIIADDDATKSNPRPAEPPKTAAPPDKPAMPARPPSPAPQAAKPEPNPAKEEPEPADVEAKPAFDDTEQLQDILDLTESMAAPPPAATQLSPMRGSVAQFRTIDGAPDVGFEDAVEKSAPPGDARPVGAMGQSDRGDERAQHLMSSDTRTAVDSAFNALAQTVLVQNARTLEDLVREMLRPMLRTWLDDNLPGVVERLVRAEIERVARGRTG